MVRVVRLERTVSWSQTRRDTNFAIPGYSLFCHDTTASGKNKVFSVCGHLCGQSRFYGVFNNRRKSHKHRCRKALRCFALPRPGYRHGTPKPGAIPTSLYPDIQFLPLYHGGGENQRFFCLWSFLWSKLLLYRFLQSGKILQTQVPQGFAAFRLALFRIPPRHSQTTRATNCANPGFWGIQFYANCGQTCGQVVFLTISACGGSACIADVSRDCGHGIFRLEGGATRSQNKRAGTAGRHCTQRLRIITYRR